MSAVLDHVTSLEEDLADSQLYHNLALSIVETALWDWCYMNNMQYIYERFESVDTLDFVLLKDRLGGSASVRSTQMYKASEYNGYESVYAPWLDMIDFFHSPWFEFMIDAPRSNLPPPNTIRKRMNIPAQEQVDEFLGVLGIYLWARKLER